MPSITDSLGWALYKRGRLPEAIETLQQGEHRRPGAVGDQRASWRCLVQVGAALRGALRVARGAGHRRGSGRARADRGQDRRRADQGDGRALMPARPSRRRPSSTSRSTSAGACPTGATRSRPCSPSASTATASTPSRRRAVARDRRAVRAGLRSTATIWSCAPPRRLQARRAGARRRRRAAPRQETCRSRRGLAAARPMPRRRCGC